MFVDVYTEKGNLVEIHYYDRQNLNFPIMRQSDRREEYYILLLKGEPRVFHLNTAWELEETQIDQDKLHAILEKAEQKKKETRLQVMLHPDSEKKAPVIHHLQNLITEQEISRIKEKLAKEAIGYNFKLYQLSIFFNAATPMVNIIRFSENEEDKIYTISYCEPRYFSFCDRVQNMTVAPKVIGTIQFRYETVQDYNGGNPTQLKIVEIL